MLDAIWKEDILVRRRTESKAMIEGGELTRLYFESPKILFATSTLPPGERSPLDPGHEGAHEVGDLRAGTGRGGLPTAERVRSPGSRRCCPRPGRRTAPDLQRRLRDCRDGVGYSTVARA